MSARALLTAVLVTGLPLWTTSASAQGNGNAFGRGKKNAPAVTMPSAAGSAEIQVSGTGTRNFGSWLDDASVLAPGDALLSVGFGLWKMPGYRELDFPAFDAAYGLHPRIQVGGSVPYFYAHAPDGPTARGFGNTYLNAKIQLRAAQSRRLGLAVTPVLEMLTTAPTQGASRYSWGVPFNIEIRRDRWRSYGSVGYFSRGAIFVSAAVEAPVSSRATISGAISQSHSMKSDQLSFELGLTKTRLDVTGSASVALAPRVLAYGSLGRTISKRDANSAVVSVAAGVALQLRSP